MFDYLIVGAGLAGSVLAERLTNDAHKKVLLIDKRTHIGGNTYDYYDQAGVLVHKYGPHIFHTNSAEVFNYLSRFTEWRPYEHRVLSFVDGKLFPFPINLTTLNQLYNLTLNSTEAEALLDRLREPITPVQTAEDAVVSQVGRDLYEKFFRNYTCKQWGCDPAQLDKSVTSRIPVRTHADDRYFTDTYQYMPLYGYTRMCMRMVEHPNIHILLNTDYHSIKHLFPCRKVIYTGPIDAYFDYCYGKLPYRSLHFQHETLPQEKLQPVAVVNYPNVYEYTRITEYKYLTGQVAPHQTSITYEYPCWNGDPYYPVPCSDNTALYQKYKALADTLTDVYFVGRLATYRYYNMDQVVAQALTLYARLKEEKPNPVLI